VEQDIRSRGGAGEGVYESLGDGWDKTVRDEYKQQLSKSCWCVKTEHSIIENRRMERKVWSGGQTTKCYKSLLQGKGGETGWA